jgi:uncharacterized membrane protein YfcA
VLLGAAVAVFGTLVGAGGGFILVPVLLLMHPDREPADIAAIGLLVVFANSVSGSIAYARQRRIDYRSAAWFAGATLPGALAGALVVGLVPRRAFDAIFGAVLMAVGAFLVLRKMPTAIREPLRGRGVVHRELRDADGITYIYAFQLWKGVATSLGIGFISSLLGIGGGVIQVPVMATMLRFPIHIATATSQLVLAFMSGEGTAVHIATGTLSWDGALAEGVLLSIGAVAGAQAGARIARRTRGSAILRALAGALILVGARLIAKAAGI